MDRLFSEAQWRAIAAVEFDTQSRSDYDAFHAWCDRKRILGGVFSAGEFYLGAHPGYENDRRVFERVSGLDFSVDETKEGALAVARERILLIDWYLPSLLDMWAERNADVILRWDEMRANSEAHAAIRKAREEARANKPIPRRRQAIFDEAGGKCHYCKTELELRGRWHIEHKLPKALGGDNSPDNLVAACAPCNHAKKDKTDVEFFALLAERAAKAA
jgi:5-methylcytosine-specific restriction endonuclease McrA